MKASMCVSVCAYVSALTEEQQKVRDYPETRYEHFVYRKLNENNKYAKQTIIM